MADKKEKIEKEEDKIEFDIEGEEKPEIEVKDDTPDEDKGKKPMPKEIADAVEKDDLKDYDETVQQRFKQAKKLFHDERREREAAQREREEAVAYARQVLEENKKLKTSMAKGGEVLAESFKTSAQLELDAAKKLYREAYEAGDPDKMVEAQEKMAAAINKAERLKEFRPALQETEKEVEKKTEAVQKPRLDPKTEAWQERNKWFGSDEEMTAAALGLHQKLIKEHGRDYVTTDEYWSKVDETMLRRFPEAFGESDKTEGGGKSSARTEAKPATVVAPASRSTSPKRIVLKQSQINIAKRLGISPEQYAREQRKLEN